MKNRHVWLLMLLLTVTIGIKTARLQAQETAPCSSSLTPSLELYQWGQTTPGEPNNVRRQPNLYSEIVGQLPAENLFRVLAGPHCADGITWWQVETEGSTLRGWMAEGMNGEAFIESLNSANSTEYRELLRMGRGTIEAIAWRPDGKALLVAGSRGIAYYTDDLDLIGYWDKPYSNEEILSIAWHPDGRQFVTGGDSFSWDWQNGILRVWDAFTGKPIREMLGNTEYSGNPISSEEIAVGWNSEGDRLLSIGTGQTTHNSFRLWNATTQELLVETPSRYSNNSTGPGAANSIAWSSEHHQILIYPGRGCHLEIWSTITGNLMDSLRPSEEIDCLDGDWNPLFAAWSPDSTQIVTTGWNRETKEYVLQIWDANSFELRLTIPVPVNPVPNGKLYAADPLWVVWSTDGQNLITVNADASIRTWEAKTGKLINTITLPGQTAPLQVVSWQPDQKRLATSDIYHTLRVWDAQSGELLSTQLEHAGRSIIFASWSPDGNRIATVTQIRGVYSEGSRIHVWNATTGATELSIDSDNRLNVFWSADGTKLFSGTETATSRDMPHLIWEAQTGELLRSIDETSDLWQFLGEPENSRTIDGKRLYHEINDKSQAAIGSEGMEYLASGESDFDPLWTVINPTGNRLAIVSHPYSAEIQIHTMPTLEQLAKFSHRPVGFESSEIDWLAWSPDGERLLSAGLDGTLRIWGTIEGNSQ